MQTLRYQAGGRAFAAIARFHPELTSLRRELHAHPELGFEEHRTSARVREVLRACQVDELHEGVGGTGVVAVIHGRGRGSGAMVGLRADMDALPMTEHNDFAWKSDKSGLMHGCGHDGHVTMLLGAARYLAASRNFDGTAVLIFQPGEEGFGGARVMIEDGLFERFPVQSVYALHNWPMMAPGTVGLNEGAMMAAADRITIQVSGKGGHGAHPYQTVDVVLVAAHIVTALQGIVARNVRAIDSAVLSICAAQAGDLAAFSVMPGEATLVGTVRTFSPEVQDLMERRIHEVCAAVALGFGASASVHYERIYPATINTAAEARFAGDVAARLVGEAKVQRKLEPSMGAEDFSFMLQHKPGAYLRLGQGGAPLHSSRYDFNDEVLPLGAALHAGLVEQAMPLPPGD
ncbi:MULTISPECIES: M20 aminoacylase family protein [Comamonas]|uniref:Amidohydrolase n=1 Tax=Comamonas flocculans TaxID=2597701 RepID=A0A5B8RW79_9BURK|nr:MULTISPECIES: M20 aminoacylase family protein [Comamonas]QEA13383.1 amidohydrolase [Comamonas flocculans]QXL83431.1 amidohydrolase [Comamonas sp. NLF-1-9]